MNPEQEKRQKELIEQMATEARIWYFEQRKANVAVPNGRELAERILNKVDVPAGLGWEVKQFIEYQEGYWPKYEWKFVPLTRKE